MAYTAGSRFLKTDYPIEISLSGGGLYKLPAEPYLKPEEDLTSESDEGLNNGW